jgi:hypothetical protein
MRVFISWSKPFSHAVAEALHRWLPQVLQTVDPFLSAADIDPGTRWSTTIADALQTAKVGLICVTRENRHEPWLNFEAGALAKTVDEEDVWVIPLLIDLVPTDLDGPLVQFQAIKTLDHDGIWHVVRTINNSSDRPLEDARLQEAFDVWWPRLEVEIDEIRTRHETARPETPLRDQRELLEEILTIVRRMADDEDQQRVLALIAGNTVRAAGLQNLKLPQASSREEVERDIGKYAVALGLKPRTVQFDGALSVALVLDEPVDLKALGRLTSFADRYGVSLALRDVLTLPEADA